MTHDQLKHHLRRMSAEPSYGVGYRAGLCGTVTPRCAGSYFDPVAMADGWRAGLTEAMAARETIVVVA